VQHFFFKISLLLFTKKVGKLPASHRYNRLPLLPSDPGGFQQELVAQDLPGAKVEIFGLPPNKKCTPRNFRLHTLTYTTEQPGNKNSYRIKNPESQ